MPTAAKIVAGLCLAALAYIASEMVKTLMPPSTAFGVFTLVNAAIGLICGWVIVGNRAGRGYSAAISNGFTGTVAMVFWALFVHSVNEMVENSFRRIYDGPIEAAAAVFEILVGYAATMLDASLLTTLLFGAILAGLVSEAAARRWR